MNKYTEDGNLNLEFITDIQIEGIDIIDYPDFSNVYVPSAKWITGEELNEEELDRFNADYGELIHTLVLDALT